MNDQDTTSTRPYLIRALYEWCTDNGLTPHVVVRVDGSVQVPLEYVKTVKSCSISATTLPVHCNWVMTTLNSKPALVVSPETSLCQ